MTHHHRDYARRLGDVLTDTERDALDIICQYVREEFDAEDRYGILQHIGANDERWTAIVATACATEPATVEALLCGGAPLPGTARRYRQWRGVQTYAEATKAEAERQEQARATARHNLRRMTRNSSGLSESGTPLPDGWLEAANAADARQTAAALGMELRGGKAGPCPACGAEQRGSTDRRPPINADDNLWHCQACHTGGTSTHLVALAMFGRPRFQTRDEAQRLGQWFIGAQLL